MLSTPLVVLFEQYVPVNNEEIQGDGIRYELLRNQENENFLPGLQMYFQVDYGKKIFQMSLELQLRSMYFLIDFQVSLGKHVFPIKKIHFSSTLPNMVNNLFY